MVRLLRDMSFRSHVIGTISDFWYLSLQWGEGGSSLDVLKKTLRFPLVWSQGLERVAGGGACGRGY